MQRLRELRLILPFVLAASFAPVPAAQAVNLTPDLVLTDPPGNLYPFQVSPDGSRVVYRTDLLTPGAADVFSAPVDGSSAPRVIDGALLPIETRITPDGTRVVLCESNSVSVVGIDGGSVTRLYSGSFGGLRYVGNTHAYFGNFAHDHLYSVPLDGSTPAVRRHARSGDVRNMQLSGTRLVYEASGELYSLEVAGTNDTPLALSDDFERMEAFQLDPGSPRVVFWAFTLPVSGYLLYSRRFDQPPVPLSPSPDAISSARFFQVSPDGLRVVFTATLPGVHSSEEYYSARLDGSAPAIRLAPGYKARSSPQFSPDSAQVYFTAEAQGLIPRDVLRVAADGSAPAVRMTDLTGTSSVWSFQLAPDGNRLVFWADRDVPFSRELYSLSTAGGPPVRLAPGQPCLDPYYFVQAGNQLMFRGASEQLFLVPSDGSTAPLPLSVGFVSRVADFRDPALSLPGIELAGDQVLYPATPFEHGKLLLYRQAFDGSPPVQLTGYVEGETAGDVANFVPVPGGRHVVFGAETEREGTFELCSAELAPPFTFRRLGLPLAAPPLATPDGQAVLVRSSSSLYCVAVDGAFPARLLSSAVSGTGHFGPQLTPDGTRAVYHHQGRLYLVPLDGTLPPRDLSPASSNPLANYLRLTADGLSVVFLGYRNSQYQLFRLPLDGSALPLPLSGNIQPDGSLLDRDEGLAFALSPDGRHVVFAGDLEVDGRVDIYSARTDGSSPRFRLASMPSGALLSQNYAISPDSQFVVFRADATVDERYELYSVPITGGALVSLSAPLQPTQDVRYTFDFAPDGTNVLYVADKATSGINEIFRVPCDGSAASVKISGATAGSGVLPSIAGRANSFEIDHRYGRVVFYSNLTSGAGYRLLSAPIHGSGPVIQLDPRAFTFSLETIERAALRVDHGAALFRVYDGTSYDLRQVSTRGGAPSVRIHPTRSAGMEIRSYTQSRGAPLFLANLESRLSFSLFLYRPDPAPPFVQER